MHLTIIAYSAKLNWEIEPAIFRVDSLGNPRKKFERCQELADLKWLVGEVVNHAKTKVTRLDIFGHGSAGALSLGTPGEDVVTDDEATWGTILELDEFLDATAEVRLLGCNTATKERGLKVLKGLEARLSTGTKKRTVWGSLASLLYLDFGAEGFRPEVAKLFLVSGGMLTKPVQSTGRIAVGGVPVPSNPLPKEYVRAGLGNLSKEVGDEQFSVGDMSVLTFASQRVVGLRKGPAEEWSDFRWAGDGDAPSREQLESHLKNR